MAAWHAGSVCCSRAQSACEQREAESPKSNSAAASRASKSGVVATGRQAAAEVFKEEFPQAWRGPGRTEWVPSGQARRQGTVTTARGGRGRETHGGVLARLAYGRGAPSGPEP